MSALAVLPSCQAASAVTPDPQVEGQRWWSYVKYLASDEMEGRLTGSEGYRRAARYVTEQFQASGLKPKGANGYLQPVRFDVQRIQAAQSSLTLLQGGQEHRLTLGEDALLGSRLPQPKDIEAPLVFVGYGLHIPEANYDDLAGQDLHGKIIVYLNGGPSQLASALTPRVLPGSGESGCCWHRQHSKPKEHGYSLVPHVAGGLTTWHALS